MFRDLPANPRLLVHAVAFLSLPKFALSDVGGFGASRNCVLPISQAGFTCERAPHIDSIHLDGIQVRHLFGVTNE